MSSLEDDRSPAAELVVRPPPTSGPGRASSPTLLLAVPVALAMCAGLLVSGSRRGIDLTDEIFYLVWTRDPRAYELTYQPFGYLLHPLFVLVRGELQAFRLAGFAVAAAAGTYLGGAIDHARRPRWLGTAQGALAALTIFYPWIITPSYNSAANVGAMLIVGGTVVADARTRSCAVAGIAATGLGLWLAAFAKPPLLVIGVIVALVVAMLSRSARRAVALVVAMVLAAVLTFLLITPSELIGLVGRMVDSQHILALPNTPLGLPAKLASEWTTVPLPLSAAALLSVTSWVIGWVRGAARWSRWPGYAAVALSLYYLGDCTSDAIDGWLPDFLGLALIVVAAGYAGVLRPERGISLAQVALLLGAPLAVALGTFNNFWAQLNFSMAFPFVALFALAAADPIAPRRAVALVLAVIGPVAVMLLAATYPYSLPASIFGQRIAVDHPLARGRILVDPETATFIRSANGLARGALLIDLSGTGPGVAAVLGARAPVLAWLNPATASWPDVVWARLSIEERERAWFVAPVLPLFAPSAPARWLLVHRASYCRRALPPMTFWGEERSLVLWRPCRAMAAMPR